MKNGFTLIELLVVVLIIGILAAVALPQYTTAVDKARFSTLMAMTKAVKDAQELYYLANGVYSLNLEDIGAPLPEGWTLFSAKDTAESSKEHVTLTSSYVFMNIKKSPSNSFLMWYDKSWLSGRIDCYAYHQDKARGEWLCKAFGAVKMTDTGDCAGTCSVYRLK